MFATFDLSVRFKSNIINIVSNFWSFEPDCTLVIKCTICHCISFIVKDYTKYFNYVKSIKKNFFNL